MSPASKATAPKRVPASRSSATTKAEAKKNASVAKNASVSKKAAPAAKKAAMTKKSAPTAKRAAPAKRVTPAAKKVAPVKKKAGPATKKAVAAKTVPAAKTGKGTKKAAKVVKTTKKAAATTKTTAAPRPIKTLGSRPKAPTPVKPKTGPYAKEAKFLDEQKELLLADRAIYQEQATSLRAEADSLALEREPGDVQFDEESGEGGTVTVDRERNLALSGQAALAVEEIDDALGRVADKTYGYCERCFQPIPKPRLRALPHARLCVACKSGGLSRR